MGDTILLTGFGPFGTVTSNLSQAVVEQLDGAEIEGFNLVSLVLPVQLERATALLETALSEHAPAAVIAAGVHSEARPVSRLEVSAKNLLDYGIPDVDGEQPHDVPVEAEGPEHVYSTLPVGQIKRVLDAERLECELSNDAGTYLCNAVFYWLARRVQPAGFVHIPRDPACFEQALRTVRIAAAETARRLAAQRVEATA